MDQTKARERIVSHFRLFLEEHNATKEFEALIGRSMDHVKVFWLDFRPEAWIDKAGRWDVTDKGHDWWRNLNYDWEAYCIRELSKIYPNSFRERR